MNSNTQFFQKYKSYILSFFIAFGYLLVTFVTDTKIFSKDGLNMNCLPIDLRMVGLMHFLTKLLVFLFVFFFVKFILYSVKHPKLLITFLGFLGVYIIGLILTYPGYYMSDDPIIFAYATRYYPVYWHNYLTSLFYMTGISLFPASCGPVLLSDILYAIVYAYLFDRGSHLFKSKISYLLLLAGIMPFTLLGALMCFRPGIYSSFFTFFFIYLYFEKKEECTLSIGKLCLLSLLTAVLSFWRSESMVMLILCPVFILFVYWKQDEKKNVCKKAALYFVLTMAFFMVIKLPQSIGEKTYYGKDYLIISTTRPLTVMVHRDQTYEGAKEDLANINAITDLGYLSNDSLSCSAYNRYNTDRNEGKYTQTGADSALQSAYIKSAVRMILHNLDLYLGERIQLFLVTNGIFNYNKDMVLNLKPVVTTDFHLYDHDRAYGFEMLDAYKRIPLSYHEGYALTLFKFGGEAYLPMLIILLIGIILTLLQKKGTLLWALLILLAREAVIFLTAPASFIQYSYPMMYVVMAYLLLELVNKLSLSKQKEA